MLNVFEFFKAYVCWILSVHQGIKSPNFILPVLNLCQPIGCLSIVTCRASSLPMVALIMFLMAFFHVICCHCSINSVDGLGGVEPLAICLSKIFLVLMDGNGRLDQPHLFASRVCLLSFSHLSFIRELVHSFTPALFQSLVGLSRSSA